MPLTYDQISSITQKKYIPVMYDNIWDSGPLVNRAKKKFYKKIDGGTSIMVPLNYAKPTSGGWYSGADTLSTQDSDIATAAEYQWKQLYANISVNRLDELKNNGDAQVLDFVKQKVKIAEKYMVDSLSVGLYSNATDAKSIVGLRQIVNTSSTVGGISQTTYSWWAAQLDSSTTTLTMAALQTQFNAASINNDSPSVGVSTRAIYNSYYGLLQPQQRFQDSDSAKGGFTSLMFNGVPILADNNCPSSNLFFLNEEYIHLFVHREEDMRFEPFTKPVNQNVKSGKVYWAGAFGSSNNRMHARLSGLTA